MPQPPETAPAAQAEPLAWLDDGSPYSTRFEDRYHSHQDGGITQSRGSFLHGCGLPAAWQDQPHWRVLETGFGLGLNFLVTWQAWRDDPRRCHRLHFISTEAWPVNAEALVAAARQRYPALLPLAEQLAAQYLDMHTGLHRLRFDDGRVHLTLAIGDSRAWLRSEGWQADSIYLDGFNPAKNPDIWSVDTLKAVARCCTPQHTQLATWCVARNVRDALAQCGFQVERVAGTPPKKHNLRALYAPHWAPKRGATPADMPPPLPLALRNRPDRHCVVIGAGIAGASMARAMAERGWQVTVLDQAGGVAQGASALPIGLFAPHISPDDAPLSRLSRAGVRCTRHAAERLLRQGIDWAPSGVLEHRIGKKLGLPKPDHIPESDIPSTASRQAETDTMVAAGLMADTSAPAPTAVLHTLAGWLKPAALVRALLQHPAITTRTVCKVSAIQRPSDDQCAHSQPPALLPPTHHWTVLDSGGGMLAQADCVVLAAAHASLALAGSLPPDLAPSQATLPLHAVRGQVAWGAVPAPCAGNANDPSAAAHGIWPTLPVNGKGSLVFAPVAAASRSASLPDEATGTSPATTSHQERLWVSGGTFERDEPLTSPTVQAVAQALEENRQRLPALMPAIGAALATHLFDGPSGNVQHWGAVRCTVPDRAPIYGALHPSDATLLVATGLGSRGLTLACLCAEILAAQLHDEPLPVSRDLARMVSSARFHRSASTASKAVVDAKA